MKSEKGGDGRWGKELKLEMEEPHKLETKITSFGAKNKVNVENLIILVGFLKHVPKIKH